MGKITKSIMKGAAAAKKAAEKAKKSMDKPDVEMRLEKRTRRKDEAEAKVTPKTRSIGKGIVTATAKREAAEANMLADRKREVEGMDEGLRKRMMKALVERQEEALEARQAADVDRASRKSTQANRDRVAPKPTIKKAPWEYSKGGYVNCGASMKPDGKRRK